MRLMVFEAANADEAINTIEAGIPIDLVADSRAASLVAWRATGSELARVKVEPERQKCGTVLQARLWLPSNSRKRGLPAPSPTSARTEKSLSRSTDSRPGHAR